MAKFVVDDYIDIGTGGPLGATSWRVFKDKEKTILIDESIFDEKNLNYWHSPLPKEDGSGEFYHDLEEFYLEVEMYFNITPGVKFSGYKSDVYTLGPLNQRDEMIKITDKEEITFKTTYELGWYEK